MAQPNSGLQKGKPRFLSSEQNFDIKVKADCTPKKSMKN